MTRVRKKSRELSRRNRDLHGKQSGGDGEVGVGYLRTRGNASVRGLVRFPCVEEARCHFFVSDRKKVLSTILHTIKPLSIRIV